MNSAYNHLPRHCRVTCEASPQSLGRVYALLTLLNLLPASTSSSGSGDGLLNIEIHFESVNARDFDLLLRKIAQLTETIHVAETRKPGQAGDRAPMELAR